MKCFLSLLFCLAAASVSWAGDPTPVQVRLDWKPNAQFAGLLLAEEKGWYAEAGLAVTIHPNDFKRDVIDTVAEDDHAIGSSESRGLVEARSRGVPIKAVATMLQVSPFCLISHSGANVIQARDLIGKRIGLHRPVDLKMLQVLFAHAGVTDPKYEWKKVGFALKEFERGEVDVVQGYLIDELVELRLRGEEVRALPLYENGWHDYAQVFFVNERFLDRDPETIRRFLEVSFRGWKAALAQPEDTARLIVQKYSPDLKVQAQAESLRQIGPLMTAESPRMGDMQRETWERIFEMFKTYQLAPTPAKVDDLVDFRFVKN